MKKPVSDTYLAAVFAAVIGAIFTWAGSDFWADLKPLIGVPLVDLLRIFCFLGFAAFSFAILHYFGVLGAGAEPVDTRERKDYDALRQRIAAGNWIAREYARRLNVFLDAIDRFFGDEGMADRTLFPRAFGLRTPAPLWTAAAFDRCLLLALVYPVAAIMLIWAVSNHVGPAEAALQLHATDDWGRATTFMAVGILAFTTWSSVRAKGFRLLAWLVGSGAVSLAYVVVAIVAGGSVGVASVLALYLAVAGAVALANAAPGSPFLILFVGVAFAVATAGAFADTFTRAIAAVFAFAGAYTAFAVIVSVQTLSKKRGWQGLFLSVVVLVMILVCFAGATFLSHLDGWRSSGPLLLFLGLLTLLNAPFDWLSLGLTRALMRRGLEREKWWPYFYAVIDALLASIVIAFLAMAMVAGVQLFDDLAVRGGGERVLPSMGEFLYAIKANPGKPEYWWVYATLFSTMLPSLINLFIAGVSLARGVPGVSSWLLGKVRDGEAVPAYDRLLVAIVLALQGVVGLTIAIVAQGFLFWIIIWQGMPRLGIGALDLAHFLAH